MCRRLDTFRGDSSIRTWLYGIVRNVASNHLRALRRRGPTVPLSEEPPSPQRDPAERAEDARAMAFVQEFLNGLDQKKRDLFVLALLEEVAIPEVARALGIPLNTAYTRVRRVRIEFREALDRYRGRR